VFQNEKKPLLNLFLKLSFLAFFGLLFISCKDLPDEKSAPTFTTTWDTIVARHRLILPLDSLVLKHTYGSSSEQNVIIHSTKRLAIDYVEFYGPDSDFVISREFPVVGKFNNQLVLKELIPEGIRPGLYQFSSTMKDARGTFSNAVTFKFPIDVSAYPGIVVDTPTIDFLKPNRIANDTFKLKIRAFGFDLKNLSLQWFDSLKKDTLEQKITYTIAGGLSLFPLLEKQKQFPFQAGKLFFLKATVTNVASRSSEYWIPFERTKRTRI